ncbi:MAG TPA: hypothetical protein VMV57_10505, partial [Terracidiphilus sp.]|nr:hypothetical protein [Terracidiphilus sp.]
KKSHFALLLVQTVSHCKGLTYRNGLTPPSIFLWKMPVTLLPTLEVTSVELVKWGVCKSDETQAT